MNKSITITGDLGSGKSSISNLLHKALGYEIKSIGSIQRQIAQELNMSITEFNKYMESHPQIDQDLDNKVVELGKQNIPRIYDSRLAWHFIPESFKIYLYVSLDISAERVLKDKERVNEQYEDRQNAKQNLKARRDSELLRFKTQYHIDLLDYTNYDLVIDTGHATPEYLADLILTCYRANVSGEKTAKYWISPSTLAPDPSADASDAGESHADCPVRVRKIHDDFSIHEGYHRVRAALQNRESLIPVELVEA